MNDLPSFQDYGSLILISGTWNNFSHRNNITINQPATFQSYVTVILALKLELPTSWSQSFQLCETKWSAVFGFEAKSYSFSLVEAGASSFMKPNALGHWASWTLWWLIEIEKWIYSFYFKKCNQHLFRRGGVKHFLLLTDKEY